MPDPGDINQNAGTSSSGNLGEQSLKDFNMRLFGIPYQWNEYTDIRFTKNNDLIGYQFLQNFIMNPPLVTFIPGSPRFTEEKESSEGGVLDIFEWVRDPLKLVSNQGGDPFNERRFYQFQPAEHLYNQQVNAIWKVLMAFFGFTSNDSSSGPDKTSGNAEDNYYNYSWGNYRFDIPGGGTRQTGAFAILSDAESLANAILYKDNKKSNHYIQFYIEPRPFTDTFSNTTNESMIGNLVGKAEDIVTEGRFLFGASAETQSYDKIRDMAESMKTGVSSLSKGMGPLGSLLSRIAGVTGHIAMGDSIVFPKVYASSAYNRSYEISIVLESPYGDLKSYCTNILAPIVSLLPMAAPKQTSANSYFAPWIIRAYCPGSWYCDMGIISSMSITRNSELKDVNVMGLPLSVKIDISIEDLYSDLMVPGTGSEYTANILGSNRPLTHYLGVMSGFDLIYPDRAAFSRLKWTSIKEKYNVSNATKVLMSAVNDWLTVDVLGLGR